LEVDGVDRLTMGDPTKMTPETRLHVDVEVLADRGQWWPAVIEHVRERGGQREAWVRYSTGVDELRLGWFGLDKLRESHAPAGLSD
jgi:hypothetical protein